MTKILVTGASLSLTRTLTAALAKLQLQVVLAGVQEQELTTLRLTRQAVFQEFYLPDQGKRKAQWKTEIKGRSSAPQC